MPNNPQASNPFPGTVGFDGSQRITGSCAASERVQLFSGNVMSQASLVSVSTVGFPLSFYLTYNSQSSASSAGPVGWHWQHNYMMALTITGSPATHVLFTTDSGAQVGYVSVGGAWVLENVNNGSGNYLYFSGVLTNPAPNWQITMPDGSYYTFDSNGLLRSMVDKNGNATAFTYTGGLLTAITEPTGRGISLSYTSGLLTGVTDPNGNTSTLSYDGSSQLTQMVSPAGCTLGFGYDANHHLTSRTDATGYALTYGYTADTPAKLASVTDPQGNGLSYAYDTVIENVGDSSPLMPFARTTLTDARRNKWEYRFDSFGNLWRTVDPVVNPSDPHPDPSGHWWHYYWDSRQKLLFEAAPYGNNSSTAGPYDNLNNSFHRYAYDSAGNRVYGFDATGLVTQWTYDSRRNVTSVYPGRANLAVQGDWTAEYGSQGYVLCGFNGGPADVASLPSYVQGVAPVAAHPYALENDNNLTDALMDPRTPNAPDTLTRGAGFWKSVSPDTEFQFQVNLNAPTPPATDQAFNLSLYTNSVDMPRHDQSPLQYMEQFGRNLIITVQDKYQTQSVQVYNNAPGVWVTFPVKGDSTHPVTVTVSAVSPNPDARISVVAFDPYDSHLTTYEYDSKSNLTAVVDPLGNRTAMTYNPDGTLASVTDALNHATSYTYGDAHKNLTQIQDALGHTTTMSYDLNGNVLTVQNPNLHTWQFQYDGKNRLTKITDPLNNTTQLSYDGNGNLTQVTDANGKITQYQYVDANGKTMNRLLKIIDALSQTTAFAYDGSGNLASVTDPLSRTTSFTYDPVERMVSTTHQPDGTTMTYAFDALNRLIAYTSPNGSQSNASLINLAGALNVVPNGDVAEGDPNAPTSPRYWSSNPAGQPWVNDSLELAVSGGTQYWMQQRLSPPPGVSTLITAQAHLDGGANGASVSLGVLYRTWAGPTAEKQSGSTTLPAGSSNWVPIPLFRVDLPGNAQFTRFTVPEIHAYGTGTTGSNVYFGGFAMYNVSNALGYDREGRLKTLQAPDGSQVRMVRDHFGRVVRVVDARARATAIAYDPLDRVVSVTDPDQNTVQYQYDPVGNLTAFIDPRGNLTAYGYDAVNRLLTITYPDNTAEHFTYDPASNLATYTNNRSQQRTFSYDIAERLLSVQYQTDMSRVSFSYDPVGNLLTRTERNNDLTAFFYDAIYRLTASERQAVSTATPSWSHLQAYDAVGNRTSLTADAGGRFDVARFDEAGYAVGSPLWTVPAPGYDALDRMPAYQDRLGKQTNIAYDVDSNRTAIAYPNGSPAPATSGGYDIRDRLLNLATSAGSTGILSLNYGYDPASNRVSLVAGGDTFDFGVDDAGRLIEAVLNAFVERRSEHFQAGTLSGTAIDPTTGGVVLLGYGDALTGNISADRWRLGYAPWPVAVNQNWYDLFPQDFLGLEVRGYPASAPSPGGLAFTFPRGYFSKTWTFSDFVWDHYGYRSTAPTWTGAEHREMLSGDFDVQVNFSNVQQPDPNATASIIVADAPVELGAANSVVVSRNSGGYNATVVVGGTTVFNHGTGPLDATGTLRIVRSGGTVTMYNGSTQLGTYTGFPTTNMYNSLYFSPGNQVAAAMLQAYVRNLPSAAYPALGTYTSTVYDAGRSVAWNEIAWTATTPTGTAVKFQVAVSSSAGGPWTYVGPDGTSSTFFLASPAPLPTLTGRYFRYQATLTGNGTATPTLTSVDIAYSGTNPSSLEVYTYDGAGNITMQSTTTASGTATEVRDNASWPAADRINNLNQIMRNDVTPAGGATTTYRYTYDASGNMTSKSDGLGNVWNFTWDEDNRLTQWQHLYNNVVQATVSYVYDSLGRMLTRTDTTGTTTFEWNGMDVVREIAPGGAATRYYIPGPGGELMSFERGGIVYQLHADALGSVRAITDGNGAMVSHFEFDAWGSLLASSVDGVPGGWNYCFVGALGVRYDPVTGLHYMRQRWYDVGLGRFVSRDPADNPLFDRVWQINSAETASPTRGPVSNTVEVLQKALRPGPSSGLGAIFGSPLCQHVSYAYSKNSPMTHSDPSGLQEPVSDAYLGYLFLLAAIGAAKALSDLFGASRTSCHPKQLDYPPEHDYSECDDNLTGCLNTEWQPKWNRKQFGPRMDCGACYRECKHAGGVWPHYKCPLGPARLKR